MANFQPQLKTSTPSVGAQGTPSGATPTSVAAQGVANVAQTIGTLFANKSARDKTAAIAAQKVKDDKSVAGFQEFLINKGEQLRRTTGADSSKVQTATLSELNNVIKANPHLRESLTKTYKEVITTKGMGEIIAGGTVEEKVIADNQKSATDAGWDVEDTDQYMKMIKNTEELKFQAAQYQAQQNKDSQDATKIKSDAQVTVSNIVEHKTPDIFRKLNSIVADQQSGKITPEEAEALVAREEIVIQSLTTQEGQFLDSTYMTNITKPLGTLFTNARSALSGGTALTALQNQNKSVIEIQKSKLLKNPEIAPLVAASEMLGHSQSPLIAIYAEKLLKNHLFQAEDPLNDQDIPSPFSKDKDTANATYDILLDNMGGFEDSNRTIGKDQLDSMNKSIDRLLQGVSVYQMAVNNPSDYNEITDFISDPRFGKYVKENGGLTPETALVASEVIKREYFDHVVPLLKEELLNAVFTPVGDPSAEAIPMASLASLESQGGRVTFKINPVALSKMVPLDRRIALREVENMRNKVVPVLNKMIRTGAHLENIDYNTFFEQNLASVFGLGSEEQSKAPKAPKASPSPTKGFEAQEQAAKDAGVDLSGLADGQYQDGSGQVITIKDGRIVE